MRTFRTALLAFVLLGLLLRWLDYASCPPFRDTNDELAYPWAGLSLLQTGTPISWSYFKSYQEVEQREIWGVKYDLVRPYVEKPLLYPLLTALACLAHGERTFDQVRLTTVRLVPLLLCLPSLWLLGLNASRLGGPRLGLLATAVYATLPTIVLGNRLSLTENLLIPLSLLSWWLLERGSLGPQAAVCAVACMTKQPGIYIPGAVLLALYVRGERRAMGIVAASSCLGVLVHPLVAWHYDWAVFAGTNAELRSLHASGLPGLVQTILRFPVVTSKESLFLDGSMLMGWLLLLSSPFWWRGPRTALLYPMVYLVLICLGEGGDWFFGWHVFPLYPFVALALAQALLQAYDSGDSSQLAILGLTLGSAALSLWCTVHPVAHWQPWLTLVVASVFTVIALAHHGKTRAAHILVSMLLGLWLLLNMAAVHDLPQLYKNLPQSSNPLCTAEMASRSRAAGIKHEMVMLESVV